MLFHDGNLAPSRLFFEVVDMDSTRHLMAMGFSYSEAFAMARDTDKEIAMGRMDTDDICKVTGHICRCGGQGNCQHCSN